MRCVVIRYGEIGLKGANRPLFEKRLCSGIAAALKAAGIRYGSVRRSSGRIVIEDCGDAAPLAHVFGIVSYSPAVRTAPAVEDIVAAADLSRLSQQTAFRVSVQRVDKRMALKSQDFARDIGSAIVEKTGAPVRLRGFDAEIGVDLIDGQAYVFAERIAGPGGLPVGTMGAVLALIEDEASLCAALMIAHRGARLIVARCAGAPGTAVLGIFGAVKAVHDIAGPAELAELRTGAAAVVAGHTLERFTPLPCELPVLRPLVAYTDSEIREALDGYRAAAGI